MAEDLEQELRQVEVELRQVKDQINALLEHQEKLLQQQAELHTLLNGYQVEDTLKLNGTDQVSEGSEEKWAGSFPWDKEADDVRLNIFGISSYRTNQREVVNAILSGRDVVVIMAAGGGKSLCYQLPALLRRGTTLVVSPLLSLIQDQVMGLQALDIPAGMLTSVTTKEEEKNIFNSLEKGEEELKILYVTPEKIAKSKRFMSKLEKCSHAGRLSLIAIDEAHCCSQWGHDFRPDYKNLSILKKQFPKVPMVALTATATARVQTDLKEMLQISRCVKFVSTINRPNLFYEVREKPANSLAVIDEIAEFIQQSYSGNESGIVYCFSRKECEQVAKNLCERGISAAYYHADMEANARTAVHRRWSSNKLQVIVGTVAFGMGINKPDVRFVIHHSLSKSIETYYQESGRAGRDGLLSHCLLFFRPADLPRQSCMVFYEHAGLHNLYAMVRFCQSKQQCRRAAFFHHFGEKLQDCNGMCDNCGFTSGIVELDVTDLAKSLISTVKEMASCEQKATLLQLADMWKSCQRQAGQPQAAIALAKELKKDGIEQLIVHLVLDGVLKEEFQHTAYTTNSYISLGSAWRSLLQGQRKITLQLHQGVKVKKQDGNKSGNVLHEAIQSGLASMLDTLRQGLAQSHGGIFPHAVLNSQQIAQLCLQKPLSLSQMQKVIGKTKTEQYGKQIVDAIKGYMSKHPETASQTAEWISTRASRSPTQSGSVNFTNKRQRDNRNASSKKHVDTEGSPASFPGKENKPDQPWGCISVDSDSDEVQLQPDHKTGDDQMENEDGDTDSDDDDNDDDDFFPSKRTKK